MKSKMSKKELRHDNKKKKIIALAKIIEMNDQDRISQGSVEEVELPAIVLEEPKLKRRKIEEVSNTEKKEVPSSSARETITDNQTDNDKTLLDGKISDGKYLEMKKKVNERVHCVKHGPKIRLRDFGEMAVLDLAEDERTPLFLTDIQNLLMVALLGSGSPCSPQRWCHIEKVNKLTHNLVVVIEGFSMQNYLEKKSKFTEINRIFDNMVEILLPPYKEGKLIEQIATIPLTSAQKEDLLLKHGSLQAAIELTQDNTLILKSVFPIKETAENNDKNAEHVKAPEEESVPRTKLLLSALQMIDEGYPVPLKGALQDRYKDYILTRDKYDEVKSDSPMFGLDCEMCRTSIGQNELTRISIVDENMKCVYESLVRPTNKIVDYLTKFSGITPEMMLTVTKKLDEVQKDVRELLPPDAILVGQSLHADLHAMRMMHPYVIDTSIIFNITGSRKRKTKLQTLAREFLGVSIQKNIEGHDSIEDSKSALQLTKLKLSKGIYFGDAVLAGFQRSNEVYNSNNTVEVANNLLGYAAKKDRSACIIMKNSSEFDYERFSGRKFDGKLSAENQPIIFKLTGNKEIVDKLREISINYAMSIASLQISSENLGKEKIDKTVKKIDKWIQKIWNCLSHNGLLTVIFGGATNTSNGIALIKIKKSERMLTPIES